jgi:hypothetical protein
MTTEFSEVPTVPFQLSFQSVDHKKGVQTPKENQV